MILSLFKESSNTFEGQEPGEHVIRLIRRHPFFIVMKLIFCLAAIFVPLGVALYFLPAAASYNIVILGLFVLSLWVLLLWQVFFYHLTMYSLDVWIVTNKRIIDSTQRGFFNRTISELHVSRVQDISVHLDGAIQTFFRFGDLQIQTAGTEDRFKFIQIPYPEDVKNDIMKIASQHNPAGHL